MKLCTKFLHKIIYRSSVSVCICLYYKSIFLVYRRNYQDRIVKKIQ